MIRFIFTLRINRFLTKGLILWFELRLRGCHQVHIDAEDM